MSGISEAALDLEQVRTIADYQFGPGTGRGLFPDGSQVLRSRRGTLRGVKLNGDLLCTFGRDSLINLTRSGAQRLAQFGTEKYVIASDEVGEFIKKGRSLFAKHVKGVGRFYAGEEVVILNSKGELLGWGRAAWSSEEVLHLSAVPVVKQRN
ncbi:MAG TPA: pseudouridine synthase [Thermoprotei archaeon]|nr:pseudouridine synthase [TACK group archaeon]HEV51685.1 pseudouridine synthase [Thermoprotei archaeon]